MLGRPDPFFVTQKPHNTGYLESLHRTYGEPRGALPKRNDASFKRALEFREREKQQFEHVRRESDEWRDRYTKLKQETDRISALFEKLSKPAPKDDPESAPRDRAPDGPVREHEAPSGKAEAPVPGEVLSTPDLRGPSDEHAVEGPEHGSGPVDAEGAESSGGVPTDKE
jgi:hypothetical protein